MSHIVTNLIWNNHTKKLSNTEKYVLVRMACFGKIIFPSVSKVASDTGLNIRTVERTIKSLVKKQYLLIIHASRGRRTNHYSVNTSLLAIEAEMSGLENETQESIEKVAKEVVEKAAKTVEKTEESNNQPRHRTGDNPGTEPGTTPAQNRPNLNLNSKVNLYSKEKDKNELFKTELIQCLQKIGVYDKKITKWFSKYSPEKIYAELRDINQLQREGNLKVKDPKALLIYRLDNVR